MGFIGVITWGCACDDSCEVALRGFKKMGWGENGRWGFEDGMDGRWGLFKGVNLKGDNDEIVDIVEDLLRGLYGS